MSQSNRLIHLDVLKGLAIIFVIIHHGIDTPIIPEVIDSYHMPLFISQAYYPLENYPFHGRR